MFNWVPDCREFARLLFTLPPLLSIRDIRPAQVFRRDVEGLKSRGGGWRSAVLARGAILLGTGVVAGTLIASFGGFGYAATIVSLIYILGLVAVWFLPETNGRPLPT